MRTRTLWLTCLVALLAILPARAQYVLDCACVAQHASLTVTNCQATIPDICALTTNCFRSTIVPPPPLIIVQCGQTPPVGTPVGPGTHIITVTVTVAGMAPMQCAVPFTVVAPITGPFGIQCAPAKTVNCGANWSFDPPTVQNPCCPNAAMPNGGATVSVVSTVTNGVCPMVITRTWQAVDQCGQTATCSQTVTVVDTVPPTLNCGPNQTVNCPTPWSFSTPIYSDNCTAPSDMILSIVSTVTNGVCPRVITRVWRVTDLCGNSATCTETVTIVDTVPPTITCGPNQTVNCGQQWNFPTPVISDNCTPVAGLILNIVSTTTNGACPEVVTRVWEVVDRCGNKATCTATVTIQDVTAPTITCAANKQVPCGAQGVFDPPTATDNCAVGAAGTPNVTIAVVSTVTNSLCPLTVTRTWSATDACGNVSQCSQTVTVVGGPNSLTLNCAALAALPELQTNACTGYVPALCAQAISLAQQNCPCPVNCTQTPAAGTPYSPGTYPITITLSDGAGGSATCTVNFVVTAPPGGCTTNPCPPTLTATLNTGTTNGSGGLLPTGALEQVWVNVAAPGGPTPMVVADTNQFPIVFGPWLPASATSAWVSPSVNMQGFAGLYTNRVVYDANCDRVCLTGRVASDDDGYLYVNGVLVAASGFTFWTNINHCTDFKKGPNIIEFVVNNAGGPTGFRTELEFFEECCCNTFTNVWNTGMDGTNALAVGQPDPNYVLVSAPAGCAGPAQVVGNIPGPWVPNGPNSQWIGGGPNANCDSGVYHYRKSFYLPCVDGASVVGQWTADDFGVMQLNGQTVSTIPSILYPYAFSGWHPVALTNGLICGTNYLDFYVTNWHGVVNPTGFRAELTNVWDDCCCGPLQDTSKYLSGVNVSGMMPQGSLDPQLVLSCAPPGVATGPAQVTNPNPFWMPNGPDSQWLAPVGNPNLPGGLYCYNYRFTLPPCTNGTPKYAVTGQWMGDDAGTIHVNGIPTGNNLPNGWAFTNWHPISITSGLVPGINFLTFFVTNASAGHTGIRMELTNSASCCDCSNTCNVTISCPPDIDRTICGTSEFLSYAPPIAISGCGAATTVVCVPPSPSVFPLGTTVVTCTATDAAGNSATCSFNVILRPDITPPVIDCSCLQSLVPMTVRACSAVIPNLCNAQCYSDDCTPAAQLTCTQSPAAGTVVPGGASYLITVTVTDAAGNSTQCQVGYTVIAPVDTRVWNTGATGPNAANFNVVQTPGGPANIPTVLTSPAGGAWSPNTAASSWVSFTPNSQSAAPGVYIYRLTFNVPCTNGASIGGRFMSDDTARIYLNGVPTAALSTSFTTWSPVNITSGFVPGLNTLDIYVTNTIIWTGLRTELTNTFNCCCPEAIALNCPRPRTAWVCSPNGLATVPYTVSASSLCPSPNVTVSVVCVPPSPGPFPVGVTTVNCTATDSLGNTTTCSFPVTVVRDVTPPVVTCPGPITRSICANSVAVYYKATAKDDCSPTVSLVCVPPSGTVFSAGTTIVTCTATDACGNTASCSFPVKVINNLLWQTLPVGINDCYAQSGWEPNAPGACLTTAYPGGNWKNFDVTTVNRWVGHTWNFPLSWNIMGAQIATRARPPVNGCSGGSANDSFSLGLSSCSPINWLWSRYLGAGNASPGLVQANWCNGNGCQHFLNYDLALLPLAPSGTTSLLPHMNSTKRLDFFIQDDTTVDFANLRVLRCAPSHVIGGLGVELASAKIIYGPINWCIIKDTPATPQFTAKFTIGEADGLRLPIEPLMLSDHPGSALALGHDDDGASADRLRITSQEDGSVIVSLGDLPPGVTHVDMDIEVNGIVIQSFPGVPATSGMALANFPSTDPLVELGTDNRNELFVSLQDQIPGESSDVETLRVRLLGYDGGSQGVSLRATGIPEVTVLTPEVQTAFRESPTRRTKVSFTSTDASVASVSGGQVVVNPLYEGGNTISLNALFAPVEEFRAVTPSPFGTFNPVPSNAVVRNIVRGLIGGEEVDVDQVEFMRIETGWVCEWSSARVHPARRIYWVYGPSGTRRFEVSGTDPLPVVVDELPTMIGKLGGRTPCRRHTWPKPTTLRIAGETLEAVELRILVEVQNYPVTGLTGLRLEATGAESLMLSGLGTGPEVPVLDAPELVKGDAADEEGIFIRWHTFGGILEQANEVTGPWITSPGQYEQTSGEVFQRILGPKRFFRIRSRD